MAKKRVLVVIDDADSTYAAAGGISAALRGCSVTLKKALDLAGTDILAADAFFLGCETPHPVSFACLERLLCHINLAGRPCGAFSAGTVAALKYLSGLAAHCDAVRGMPFRVDPKDGEALKAWARETLTCKP
jgi:hypothetical protein